MISTAKRCNECEVTKSLADFHRNKSRPDGCEYKCKACAKERSRIYNARPEVQAAKAKYRILPETKLRRAKTNMAYKAQPEAQDKMKARMAVHHAIQSGKLVKPNECSKCHLKGEIQAHHGDYTKPLQVIWLCGPCHIGVHHE